MRIAIAAAVACLSIVGVTATAQVHAAIRKHTEIPAEPLDLALRTLAKDRGFQVVYLSEDVRALQTRGAVGDFTVEEALKRLLSDSRLEYKFVDENTVSIFPKADATGALDDRNRPRESVRSADSSEDSPKSSPERRLRLAQVDQGKTSSDVPVTKQEEEKKKTEGLAEIVVTGTHIRGLTAENQNATVIDRDAIIASGRSTPEEVLASLPQNFGGGLSEDSIGVPQSTTSRYSQGGGAGVNLRGLGNDATLVLLDGRRLAEGGLAGDAVDISVIPLSILDRIEVITDGASAIYGSDAVAGVVNFVIRKDFDGAESSVRTGVPYSGGGSEIQADQIFGKVWDSGNVLLSYDYFDRRPLLAGDRPYTDPSAADEPLIPRRQVNALFSTFNQKLGSSAELFAEGYYTDRDTTFPEQFEFASQDIQDRSKLYGGTLGTRIDLPRQWQLEVGGDLSRSETHSVETNVQDGSVAADYKVASEVWSLDTKLDGAVADLPGGTVRAAVGAEYRADSYSVPATLNGVSATYTRHDSAAFLETFVPLVGPNDAMPGMQRLDLNAAVRYDDYSDFGSTTNPKISLAWLVGGGLTLRGSYGTSFRAPLLSDIHTPAETDLLDLPDPNAPGGQAVTLGQFGSLGSLQAETAQSWATGLDWVPLALSGFRLNANYFNIQFKNRVTTPNFELNYLTDPLYASLITRNPTQAQIAQAVAYSDGLTNNFTFPSATLADTTAIADVRTRNFERTDVSGLDFKIEYKGTIQLLTLDSWLAGTDLFHFLQQVGPNAGLIDIANTVFNPAKLRLNAGTTVSQVGWSSSVIANYVGSYRDIRFTPVADVASFTTIDWTGGVDLGHYLGNVATRGLRVDLGVLNLFNRDPPYVAMSSSSYVGSINFDPVNANARGRFFTAKLTKRW